MMLEYVAVNWPMEGWADQERAMASGIAAYCDRRLITCIRDITPNHEEAKRLARMLNKFEASLIHFHDIVEDYVAGR